MIKIKELEYEQFVARFRKILPFLMIETILLQKHKMNDVRLS